jgi:uncharacterized protein
MLFAISPAKALDYDTPATTSTATQPLFVPQAQALIDTLKDFSPQEVSALMSLSDKLAGLNVARYQAWRPTFNKRNAKQAVLAFNGDVYDGLAASELDQKGLDWLQDHLCILSGLYGVLRPLDLMQPYRLEMGTKLANAKGSNLYKYWGSDIAQYLNERAEADGSGVLVNLASEEYFKAVDKKTLQPRIVTCAFEEYKAGQYKIISFMAKRARGMMVRFAVDNRVTKPEQLKDFATDGYVFEASVSSADKLVFRRKTA